MRSATMGKDGVWKGQVYCARTRGQEKYLFEVNVPYPEYEPYQFRLTPEQRQTAELQQRAFQSAIEKQPLPAGWVRLSYFEYQEGNPDNDAPKEFHSPHCAALYLNKLEPPHASQQASDAWENVHGN